MANLANLKFKETFDALLTLNGEPLMNDVAGPKEVPTQMSITYNSPNSKAYREYVLDTQDEMLDKLRKEDKSDDKLSARDITARRIKKLVDNAVAWDITLGDIHVVGKPKFSKKALTKFFEDYPVFLEQNEESFEAEKGFTLD